MSKIGIENQINSILQLVHHEDFTLDDFKNLINNHDNLNIWELKYEKTGDSIVHICARLGRVDLLEYLINASKTCVDIKNNDGKTPLHEACQFNQLESTRILLQNAADVNAIKRADWTPLMLACTKKGPNSLEIVRLLLNSGAIINLCNKDGWTALHLASREGDEKIAYFLLENGADFQRKTKNGRTILHVAALHGHLPLVNKYLRLLNPNLSDNSGNNALHEAVFTNNKDLIDILTQQCDVNSVNSCGFTILHLAASENLVDIIKHVVDNYKLDINFQTCLGFTPLHCAARKKQGESVKLLIDLGAKVDLKDNQGRLPSDYFSL